MIPRFGSTELTKITRDALKDFIVDLSRRGLARNTIRLAVASLRVVLSTAVEDGILPSNPAVRLGQFLKTDKPKQTAISMQPEEVEQFLATVHGH